MSNLIGSEVDVSSSHAEDDVFDDSGMPDRTPMSSSSLSRRVDSAEDLHPAVSPARAAEMLFVGDDLSPRHISAAALAQQMHEVHRIASSSTFGATTISTSDYATCAEPDEDIMSTDECYDGNNNNSSNNKEFVLTYSSSLPSDHDSPFGKDALALARENESFPAEDTVYHDTNMSSSSSSSTASKAADPAEKIYDGVKGIWGWGKGVMVLSPFLGFAEGVAGKVVELATGSTLSDVDGGIKSNLTKVDKQYINPAIEALIKALLGAFHKSEDVIKPLVESLLKPVGLIKDSSETPELTPSKPAVVA